MAPKSLRSPSRVGCFRHGTYREWGAGSVVRVGLLWLLASIALGAAPPGSAGPVRASEYELKAAFLLNFARFTEWPAGALGPADRPITIGVLGDDPFGPFLERAIAGRTVGDHPLAVRRIRRPLDAAGCPIVFIASSEKAQMTRLLLELSGPGVLTVGETDRFAELGGVIGTVVGSSRLGIVVNTDAAARASLRISSKLLAMARLVQDGKGGPR